MADSGSMGGSGSNIGGGLANTLFNQTDKNTYLGQDSQTFPLADLGNRISQQYNQNQAQQNLLFGGPGYAGAFGQGQGGGAFGGAGTGGTPRTGYPPIPGTGPLGTGTGPRGNPLPGGPGLQLPPNQATTGGINPGGMYSKPVDQSGGRSATLPPDVGTADVMQNPNARPTHRERWDPIAVNPSRPETPPPTFKKPPIDVTTYPAPTEDPKASQPSWMQQFFPWLGQGGQSTPSDPYARPPGSGGTIETTVGSPPMAGVPGGSGTNGFEPGGGIGGSTGTAQINPGGGTGSGSGDPTDTPGAGGVNQLHSDPSFYDPMQYLPADPTKWNDGDLQRPTPIRPQGDPYTDPWSAPTGSAVAAPTGGLYGGYNEQMSGSYSPVEQALMAAQGNQYLNPLTGLDQGNLGGYAQQASGQQNAGEKQTRFGLQGLSSSSIFDDPSTMGYAQQASGARTGDESSLQNQFRLFGNQNSAEQGVQQGYANMPTRTGLENSVLGQYQGLPAQTGRENDVYGGYAGLYKDPRLAADIDLTGRINSYMTTGGRGEDEAFGAYKGMLGPDGGYSAAQRNAIEQEGMNAARAGFDTARGRIARGAAISGNQSGVAANLSQLAKDQATALGGQSRQNQIGEANETQRRNEVGAGGMTNLASIANARGQYGLSALAGQNAEYGRRVEAGLGGMNQSNQQGRQLQLASLAGQTAYNDAGRGLEAASLAGQERGNVAQRGYQTQSMAGQNEFNQQGRALQTQGLAGLGNRYDAATGRQQAGLAGMQRQDEATRATQQAGLAGATGIANEAQRRREQSLAGLSTQAAGSRQRQQQGLAGMQGLYNGQQQQGQSLAELLYNIFRTPTETRSETSNSARNVGASV